MLFFTSKDENLTKAHIRYLEGRLIEQARSAGRAIVMNGQSSGAKLPESDREDMEIFLERIHQLMPVPGEVFRAQSQTLRFKAQPVCLAREEVDTFA